MSLQKLTQETRRFEFQVCQRCLEPSIITHRVFSDGLDLLTCRNCAMEAIKLGGHGAGAMKVETVQ